MSETDQTQQAQVDGVVPNMAEMLKKFTSAPKQTDIEAWKQQFGEVFISGFSEEELFVWRPLQRGEYINLQKKLRTQPVEGQELYTDADFEEWVVKACTLWSSNKEVCLQKGGTIPTLSEQIMTNSNFVSPQLAAMLVMKL